MAVLSWWGDLSVNSVNERDLNLLTSCAVPERLSVQLQRDSWLEPEEV